MENKAKEVKSPKLASDTPMTQCINPFVLKVSYFFFVYKENIMQTFFFYFKS